MLFNSFPFLFGFLPLALVLTYTAGRRRTPTLAKLTLALLSLGFYAWWRPIYLWLLLFSIAFNYGVGDQIQRAVAAERNRSAKIWLVAGLIVDIAMLGWFKYANFVADNIDAVAGTHWQLERIALPLAISFYTFQKIGYLVNSARGEAQRMSALDFTLFAAFFPQLIAGPIVHYKEVVPQLQGPLFGKLIWRNILVGLTIMAIGLFKKTVIADTLSGYSDSLVRTGRRQAVDRPPFRLARGDRLHLAALFRFLRIFGHGDRSRANVRREIAAEFPFAAPSRQYRRLLAALAHDIAKDDLQLCLSATVALLDPGNLAAWT